MLGWKFGHVQTHGNLMLTSWPTLCPGVMMTRKSRITGIRDLEGYSAGRSTIYLLLRYYHDSECSLFPDFVHTKIDWSFGMFFCRRVDKMFHCCRWQVGAKLAVDDVLVTNMVFYIWFFVYVLNYVLFFCCIPRIYIFSVLFDTDGERSVSTWGWGVHIISCAFSGFPDH